MVVKNTEAAFWKLVKIGGEHECWSWMGWRDVNGYGEFSFKNKHKSAHRLAFEFHHKIVLPSRTKAKDTLVIQHTCDNPPCCNPHHLVAGTPATNVADRDRKGRRIPLTGDNHWTRRKPEWLKHGSTNHMAKLTEDDVREIVRRLEAGETGLSLSREFGVSYGKISHIKRGRSWNHVTGKSKIT